MGDGLLRGTEWFLTLDAERCNELPRPSRRCITRPSAGATCASGGSIYTRASANANGTGSVSVSGGQRGIEASGCSLNLANNTNNNSNMQFTGAVAAMYLRNSTMSLFNALIANSGDGINAVGSNMEMDRVAISNSSENGVSLQDSSINLSNAAISNSGACGLNLKRSTGVLGTSSITSSGVTQSWASGICADGSDVDISGGMVFSNNVGGDVKTGLGGAVVLQSWNGASSFPDFASVNSLECWTAGSHIYVFPGATTQDLSTVYANSLCVSFEG